MIRPVRDRPAPGCDSPNCHEKARLYPCGWRCEGHKPVPRPRPEAKP